MKIQLSLVLAGCLALTACSETTGSISTAKTPFGTRPLPSHTLTLPYSKQTSAVRANCFPGKLLVVLNHIKNKTGRKPVLTSGHRTGGRKGSQHRNCLAADIRVPGVSDRTIIAAAMTAPGIGGIGRYCNGIIHVDVGPKRMWNHCGGKRKRRG